MWFIVILVVIIVIVMMSKSTPKSNKGTSAYDNAIAESAYNLNKDSWSHKYGTNGKHFCERCATHVKDSHGVTMVKLLHQLHEGEVKRQLNNGGAWDEFILYDVVSNKVASLDPCGNCRPVFMTAINNTLYKIWSEENWGEFTPLR